MKKPDESANIVRNGKIIKLAIKTKCQGRIISLIIDRPIGGDEATILALPRGKVKKVRQVL